MGFCLVVTVTVEPHLKANHFFGLTNYAIQCTF